MLLFQKLDDETQMPKPQKYTDTLILIKMKASVYF